MGFMPVPDVILNAPQLEPGLELYLDAFWELSSCRSVGMGLGPIPWTACEKYARVYRLDDDQADALVYHVARLDSAYLKWSSDSAKSDK